MQRKPINCKDIREMLDAYLDGTVGKETAEAIAAHLESCPECRAEYLLERQLRENIREAAPEVPNTLHRDIMAAVRADIAIPSRSGKGRRALRFGMGIAAAIFCCCLAVVPLMTGSLQKNKEDARAPEYEYKNEFSPSYSGKPSWDGSHGSGWVENAPSVNDPSPDQTYDNDDMSHTSGVPDGSTEFAFEGELESETESATETETETESVFEAETNTAASADGAHLTSAHSGGSGCE